MTAVLQAVREHGAAAELADPSEVGTGAARASPPDATRVLALLRTAAAPEAGDPLPSFDEAGGLHDLEALDVALTELAPGGLGARFGGLRRRLRDAARDAITRTSSVGTAQLCCAVLGEVGTSDDAPVLEDLGTHPALTHYAATALTAMGKRIAIPPLLRLLARTEGPAKLAVADRMLLFANELAVRIALVRDTLPGLDEEQRREIAPDIAVACRATHLEDDAKQTPEVRAGARQVLRYARGGDATAP